MKRAKKARMGRPPLPEDSVKGLVFTLRLSAAELAEIETAAKTAGKAARKWARDVLLERARLT